jgi:ElaB/YqjD/DUF883 family membrane-anchored ribosome-binding protein
MTDAGTPRSVVLPPESEAAAYDASGKSPQDIERDITGTRAELGEILDALEQRLAPRHLLDQGFDMLRETMSGNSGKIGETLRNHPVPLALIGVGVGWMLVGGIGRGTGETHVFAQQEQEEGGPAPYPAGGIGEMAGYAYARTKSALASGGMTGKAGDMANKAAAASSGLMRDTARRASDYAHQAGEQLSGAGDRFFHLMEEHPLTTAAIGLVAGTVIGLLLPSSQIEEEWIGPTKSALRDQAGQMGREAVERARDVAERSVDAAVDAVKETASAAGDAVRNAAEGSKSSE